MADSREGGISMPPLNASGYAALKCTSDDRRKRSFKTLVGDIAERLDGKDVNNINWQEDVPPTLRGKPALEILEHLHKRRVFTELEVRPLAQLLTDIHREDLIDRVEAFREEFGRHYSMPENGQNAIECTEDRRANTVSGSRLNTPIASRKYCSSTPTTEAHQESKAARGDGSNVEDCLSQVSTPNMSTTVQSRPQQLHSISLEACNTSSQLPSHAALVKQLPACESTPHSIDECTQYNKGISEHSFNNQRGLTVNTASSRKVSEVSLPLTLDGSLMSSGRFLETPSPASKYIFQSNPSSSNVSQENMLNSSSSCVESEESTHVAKLASHSNSGNLSSQRQWYESSASNLQQHAGQDQFHGLDNYSYTSSQSSRKCGRPMGHSMSQEYYHKPAQAAIVAKPVRRHSYGTPRPGFTHNCGSCHGGCFYPLPDGCSHRGLQQNCNHLSYVHTCCCIQNMQGHHNGHFANYSTSVPHVQQQMGRVYAAPLQPPIGNTSGVTDSETVKNAWHSQNYYEDFNTSVLSPKISNLEREKLLTENAHPSADFSCRLVDDHSNHMFEDELRDPEIPLSRYEPHHVITTLKEHTDDEDLMNRPQEKQVSMPQANYKSQSLNHRKNNATDQLTSNSAQTLESLQNPMDKRKLKFRSRSYSAGNASVATAASNHSLASENTLTSSSKSPVGSPPVTRSQCSKESKPLSSHILTVHSTGVASQAGPSISSKWGLFRTPPKPHLVKPNQLVWPIKRDKLNKYIYKRKLKLLTCKLSLEVMSDRHIGPGPKLLLQLHPYGTEEDSNRCVTVKVSIELPRKCQLHSETEIGFQISARELKDHESRELGRLQRRQEQVTRNFFYIKGFITHEALKESHCNYIQVIVSAQLK